jgi:hypothetical protein
MMTGFEQYTRKTRRALFLEEMEQVVPWRELCALIEPHYPKPGNGRPPVGVARMLRIYFLQHLSRKQKCARMLWRIRRRKERSVSSSSKSPSARERPLTSCRT